MLPLIAWLRLTPTRPGAAPNKKGRRSPATGPVPLRLVLSAMSAAGWLARPPPAPLPAASLLPPHTHALRQRPPEPCPGSLPRLTRRSALPLIGSAPGKGLLGYISRGASGIHAPENIALAPLWRTSLCARPRSAGGALGRFGIYGHAPLGLTPDPRRLASPRHASEDEPEVRPTSGAAPRAPQHAISPRSSSDEWAGLRGRSRRAGRPPALADQLPARGE